MQPYDEIDESNQSTANVSTSQRKTVYHPVSYISGLFRGSELNWAAFTKKSLCNLHVSPDAQLLPHQC